MSSRIFGHIPNIKVGQLFSNRIELSLSGVHPPLQAGISGSQSKGADSIVLSGIYEDDKDLGDVILYTGHGSRDLNTGKQSSHQTLSRQNLALAKSCLLHLPVRVIRGMGKEAPHSNNFRYRYDGLYYVDSYWKEKGKSSFTVWLFKLVKSFDNNLSFLADNLIQEGTADYGKKHPERVQTSIQRIIRDIKVGMYVKELYKNSCQVCNETIETPAGRYAEAAHIRPLGIPHNGPDVVENVLCLCPNHHIMFDFGGFAIDDNFELLGLSGALRIHNKHVVDKEYLAYHRAHFWE